MGKPALEIPSHVVLYAARTIPEGVRLVGRDDLTKLVYRVDLSSKEIKLGTQFQVGKDGVLYTPGTIPREKRIKQKTPISSRLGKPKKK